VTHIHCGVVLKFSTEGWPFGGFQKIDGERIDQGKVPESAAVVRRLQFGHGQSGIGQPRHEARVIRLQIAQRLNTRSCILEPRRSGGLTTTCKDAVVRETRATESQEIRTEGGASGAVCAKAATALTSREPTAREIRIISRTLAQITSGGNASSRRQRGRLPFAMASSRFLPFQHESAVTRPPVSYSRVSWCHPRPRFAPSLAAEQVGDREETPRREANHAGVETIYCCPLLRRLP
jgi:hypothetical protein